MKSFVPTDLQKIVLDAYNGTTGKFSNEHMDAIRNAIKDACGGEWNYYRFMENKYKVFAVIAEIMPVAVNASLAGKFGEFAEMKDEAMGDQTVFQVEDNLVYPMLACARGTKDIERTKIVDRNFKVPTANVGIKLYDEFDRFMAGKVDLARLTAKAVQAYENYVGKLIADTIYGSYSAVETEYKATGSFVASTLDTIIEHVKAANNIENVQIFGTASALGNIADGFGYSDRAKDIANGLGRYDTFRGSDLIALPQAYVASTRNFAVNNAHVIVLPAGEKIVKVALEGQPVVEMADAMARNDMQPEMLFIRRIGAAAITVPEGKYGIYKFE